MNPANWQISVAILADALRPISFALAILFSTWVLFDARRKRLDAFATTAWTLLALLFPPVILPLYLIARSVAHQPDTKTTAPAPAEAAPETNDEPPCAEPGETAQTSATTVEGEALRQPSRWRLALLPLLYLATLAAPGAVYFYLDYESVDARLARAAQARLDGQPERVIHEYRAALAEEDDPHIHKLLGVELAHAGRTQEALAEFLAAERGGEPDELLSFRIAAALDALGRTTEATPQYQKFLQSRLCTAKLPDAFCGESKARLQAIREEEAR